ncbi:hypothetical protein ADEAN_000809100 [Angomonas deanei]|uniref:CFAP47-like immunoglobulin-like domain-containing protein n=1 Tax=Angomonas deanei TaxID=59799 RepID=A0A7G2CMC0_9TRYP|nr:hypothetical protein ADEAN_000809100 [Angomonas deanei]
MTVDEAPPENIEFDSPLGVVSTAHVRLFNNSSKEEKVVVNNPNKLNFAVSPPNCSIAPLSDAVFKIEYTPTTVGVKQENLIALTLPNNGVWRYLCTGEGTAPLPAEAVSCSCDVGSSSVVPIEFKNTLETEITLYLAVTGDGAFQLPESAPPVKVPPGATTTLSVAFSPRDVGSKKATVEVSPREKAHKSVVWRFPLIGIAQWREATQVFRLKCTARAQASETIHIRSPFLPNKSSVITFQPDEKQRFSSALSSSLSYTLDPEPTGDEFRVNVKLSPLRPFSGVGNLIVSTPNEGTVSCRLFIDVTPAEPDDVIQISGTIGQKSVVQFDLYNVLPFKSKFIAYFTESSPREFSVTPIRGVLNPFNAGQRSASSATKISVEYFPRAARSEGLLVVDTEEMQWSFRVVGKAEQVVKRKN